MARFKKSLDEIKFLRKRDLKQVLYGPGPGIREDSRIIDFPIEHKPETFEKLEEEKPEEGKQGWFKKAINYILITGLLFGAGYYFHEKKVDPIIERQIEEIKKQAEKIHAQDKQLHTKDKQIDIAQISKQDLLIRITELTEDYQGFVNTLQENNLNWIIEAYEKTKESIIDSSQNEIPLLVYGLENVVNNEYILVLNKEECRLGLYQFKDNLWNIINIYKVALSENKGPKQNQGDKKTPEGDYKIERKTWFKETPAFLINYPNEQDILEGRTGNNILIHVIPEWKIDKKITKGCIGLPKTDIKELESYISVGTKIYIRPNLNYINLKYFNNPDINSELRSSKIEKIILHHTASSNVESTVNTFMETQNSIHYIVDKDGVIYPLVAEDKVAYHAGSENNADSIGIEIINLGNNYDPFTSLQYSAAKILIEQISKRYNILIDDKHVIGHKEISSHKIDPSPNFDWAQIGLSDYLHETRKLYEDDRLVLRK